MHPNRPDRTGQRFGRLVCLQPAPTVNKRSHWLCLCDCGTTKIISTGALLAGHNVSCGCYRISETRRRFKLINARREANVGDMMLVKRLNGLHAADEASAQTLRALGQGEVIRCRFNKPRNVRFHRKFFALLQLVYESTEKWPTVDALLVELKFRVGHVETYELSTGDVVRVPKSISFGKMDDVEFSQFFDRSMRALCEMAGDIDEHYLREAVLSELAA